MNHDKHIIIGIHIHDRNRNAMEVQRLLTEYGCQIKTRLGLHEVSETECATTGILLLEMVGDENKIRSFATACDRIDGVDVKEMIFTH